MLDRKALAIRLEAAVTDLFCLTSEYCHNALSPNTRFRQRFPVPELRLAHGGMDEVDREVLQQRLAREHDLLIADEVVGLLFRNGLVPGYVNMSVLSALPEVTVIELFISRRLRPDEMLYHKVARHAPFHPQVVIPPWRNKDVPSEEKWDVNWQLDFREQIKRSQP